MNSRKSSVLTLCGILLSAAAGLLPVRLTAETVVPLMEGYCWHQLSPYNTQCPVVDGTQSPVGCVATALAQIMHYHRSARGKGRVSYSLDADGSEINVSLEGGTYNFGAMSPDGAQSADMNELARFNFHVGAAVRMQYKPSESSSAAYAAPAGLIRHFGYSPYAIYINRSLFSDGEWNAILQNELQHGRPVLYSANNGKSSHAFILDGFNNQGLYHVIWGWGTSIDGWYAIDSLKSAEDIVYNIDQGAVVNIAPQLDPESDGVHSYNALRATSIRLPSGKSDTTMTAGGMITLVASYLYNFNQLMEDGGYYGVMIEDSEGNLVHRTYKGRIWFYTNLTKSEYYGVYATKIYSSRPDYTLRVPFQVPGDMPEGKYRVSLYYTPTYDNTQYSPVRCNAQKPWYVELTIAGDADGLETIPDSEAAGNGVLYDLTGRRVDSDNAQPGIYIRGKKKIWIR